MPVPTTPDWVWLAYEQEAASSCLRQGRTALIEYRFAATDAEPLFVLLATGAEKLLKLTFGLTRQASTGSWPEQREMVPRTGWGYRVADLDAESRGLVRAGAAGATHPHPVTELVDALDADPYIGPWLSILQRYAQQGRFYYLDRLTHDKDDPQPPRRQLWDELYGSVLRDDPEFARLSVGSWDAAHQRTIARLADSLWLWWETYYRAWVQGACGPEAHRHSSGIAPPKR